MGLQIWLPMNGNLNNQGIFNTIITSSGAIANANGKIGSCMKITSQTDSGYIPNFNTTGLTMGGWFKFNKSEIASVVSGLSYSSTANSATGNVLGNTSYGGIGLVWNSNNYYTSNEFNTLQIFATIRTSTVFVSTSSITIEFDKWTHIMLNWNINTRKLGLYKNGVLVNEKDIGQFSDGVSRNLYLNYRAIYGGNGPSASIPMYCNDIRVYDNALTAKEIKKLSQGLILHYPLSDRYNEPTTNLLPTNLQNFSMSGYDALSFSCNTSQHGKYTLSGYLTVQTNSDWVNPRITITGYYSDGSNITIASNFNIVKDGKEHFIETTGQTDTSKTLAAIKGWVLDHSSGGSHKYATGRNFQLEYKDHSTPYTSSSRNGNILYDVSGYKRNGLQNGTFNIIKHTAKHKYSTMFNGSSYITFDSLPSETKTISCWVKTSKNKSTSQIMFCDYNTKLCMSFYSGCIISYFGSGAGTGSKCTLGSEYKENDWNHIVIVVTGSNTRDVYVNGVKLSPTSNDYWADTSTGMTIGRRNTASNQLPFYGYLSDFRAYATALSAEDILELYKTPSYLASNAS